MSYRDDDDRDRDRVRGGGGRDRENAGYADGQPISLYVRNLSYRTRAEDLKRVFERYGSVKDVYIPRDYHTREPRGFAYVQFFDMRDAEDALHGENRRQVDGREITVVWAEGDRKNPNDMKRKDPGASRRDRSRSRSPDRRRRRSRSPRRHNRDCNRSCDRDRSRSPKRRSPSCSASPEEKDKRDD